MSSHFFLALSCLLIAASLTHAHAAVGITGERASLEGRWEDGYVTNLTAEFGARILIGDAWEKRDLEIQPAWGISYDVRGLDWSWAIATGVIASQAETTFADGARVHNQLTEWSIGLKKEGRWSENSLFSFEFGANAVRSILREYAPQLDKRTDTGIGGYVEIGYAYLPADKWIIGITAHGGYAAVDNISRKSTDVNASGLSATLSLGGRF